MGVGVLAAAMAWPAPKSVVKNYAYLTIMKNCYGEDIMKQYMTKFKDASATCSGKPTSISDMPAVRQYLMQLRAQAALKSPIQRECGEFMGFMKCCKAREMVSCMKK